MIGSQLFTLGHVTIWIGRVGCYDQCVSLFCRVFVIVCCCLETAALRLVAFPRLEGFE
jgi:hypothetical protein